MLSGGQLPFQRQEGRARLLLENRAREIVLSLMESKSMVDAIRQNLSNLTVTYCSICAGADKAHNFISAVVACMNQCFPGLQFDMKQLFRCENNTVCQRMLLLDDPHTLLFDDAKELSNGLAFDVVSRSKRDVPKAMLVLAGVVCSQTTGLNNKRAQQSDAILERKHATGQTWGWTLDYCIYASAQLFCMENPKEFCQGAKNPQFMNFQRQAEGQLHEAGYDQLHEILRQEHYGDAGTRDRFHMSAYHGQLKREERDFHSHCMEVLRVPPLHISHYIRPAHVAKTNPWMTRDHLVRSRKDRIGRKDLERAANAYQGVNRPFPPFEIYARPDLVREEWAKDIRVELLRAPRQQLGGGGEGGVETSNDCDEADLNDDAEYVDQSPAPSQVQRIRKFELTNDPVIWGLPTNTHINLAGAGERQGILLHFKYVVNKTTAEAARNSPPAVFVLFTEKSLNFGSQFVKPDSHPTVTSKCEPCVMQLAGA